MKHLSFKGKYGDLKTIGFKFHLYGGQRFQTREFHGGLKYYEFAALGRSKDDISVSTDGGILTATVKNTPPKSSAKEYKIQ